jgi:hypothetical protein
MKTKYFFVLLVAFIMGTQVMDAQNRKHGKKMNHKRGEISMGKVAEMQANKIIGDLGLDDKTAAKFKDVYAKYMKELNDLRKEYMPKKPDVKPGEGKANPMPTDAEVDKMMRDKFKMGRKMLDIREKYYDEFRKFLSPKQVQKVYDKGMMNRGKFHQEMNRRAGMKRMDAAKAGNRGM